MRDIDYRLIYKNGHRYYESGKPKKEYINMKSIVKLVIILVILDLHHKKIVDIKAKLPFLHNPNIRIINIINHTSGLDNTWAIKSQTRDNKVKWSPSTLQKRYYKSDNIYEYYKKLKPKYRLGSFHYNNYTYDILGKIIYEKTGMYVDEYLKKNILKDVKHTWFKINGLPVCSYGVGLYVPHISKMLKRLHMFALKVGFVNFAKKYGRYPLHLNIGKRTFYGHSGSGGQFLYMNKNMIACRFAYGDPDELPEKDQMSNKDFSNWLIANS